MHTWQMQEAKAHWSEVVKRAESEGPQDITFHGKSIAVVISRATYEHLSGTEHSLLAFMQKSPLYDFEDIAFERDQGLTREISL